MICSSPFSKGALILMKCLWACLLIAIAAIANSQTDAKPDDANQSHNSIADFGLVYPLSSDWVRATELARKRVASSNPAPNFDILLAAVYMPKSSVSPDSPFFSLRAYRQPFDDCKKSLESMVAQRQEKKGKPESLEQFSASGRDYFRVDLARGTGGRHETVICTAVKGHLLVWNAGAPNDKGMDEIVSTLNSITELPERSPAVPPSPPVQTEPVGASTPKIAFPSRVRISSGVAAGFVIKKVAPIYPDDARRAYIQGTVMLRVIISTEGDIVDLELLDGPIELAGSAVAAVRQWKYKPYLLAGRPITVETQIQVNYQLSR